MASINLLNAKAPRLAQRFSVNSPTSDFLAGPTSNSSAPSVSQGLRSETDPLTKSGLRELRFDTRPDFCDQLDSFYIAVLAPLMDGFKAGGAGQVTAPFLKDVGRFVPVSIFRLGPTSLGAEIEKQVRLADTYGEQVAIEERALAQLNKADAATRGLTQKSYVLNDGVTNSLINETIVPVDYANHISNYGRRANGELWHLLHADLKNAEAVSTSARVISHVVNDAYAQAMIDKIYADVIEGRTKKPGVILHDYQTTSMLPTKLRSAWARKLKEAPEEIKSTMPQDLPICGFNHTPMISLKTFKSYCRKLYRDNQEDPGYASMFGKYLSNLLNCDLLGCQTKRDAKLVLKMADKFGYAVDHERGFVTVTSKEAPARICRIAAFPVSVNAQALQEKGTDQTAMHSIANRMTQAGFNKKEVLVALSRRDTTKGILEQIEAFEMLLEKEAKLPSENQKLTGKIGYFLVACDTRTDVPGQAYKQLTDDVENAVARVNRKFNNSFGYNPIYYVGGEGLLPTEVPALYARPEIRGSIACSKMDGSNLAVFEAAAGKSAMGRGMSIVSEGCGNSETIGKIGIVIKDYQDREEICEAMHKVLSASHADLRATHLRYMAYLRTYTAETQGRNMAKALARAFDLRTPDQNGLSLDFGASVGEFVPVVQ